MHTFEFTSGDEMVHIAWYCLEEVSYCFSRSSIINQGHTALKIVEFDIMEIFTKKQIMTLLLLS